MKRVVLSPEREALFRAEWSDKRVTLDNIEASMGHTGETLRKLAAELGLAPREEPNPWTPEFTALVVRRYSHGETPTALGREFGLTRNQVTAKLHRLNVIRRRASEPRPAKLKAVAARPVPAASPPPKLEPHVIVPFRLKACAWPLGDPREPGFRSCGEPAAIGSYCETHHKRSVSAHQPVAKPRPYAVRGG